jgi:LmbE family N-acetylglucosaminyl deacetylase
MEVRSASSTTDGASSLPQATSVLAVCAHPDDESFGLGAVLNRLSAQDMRTSVLCFTHGESSTLGGGPAGLRQVREAELLAAAGVLGVGKVELFDHPDGALSSVPLTDLAASVELAMSAVAADLLLVFDEGGVKGHPDHRRATEAALAGSDVVPVLGWGVPRSVAAALNAEFGTTFCGRDEHEFDVVLAVEREGQRRAIACHASQSADNPVLWRRLELLADAEFLRWLRPPAGLELAAHVAAGVAGGQPKES